MHCMLMDLLHGFEVLSTTEETLFNSRNVSRLVQNNFPYSFFVTLLRIFFKIFTSPEKLEMSFLVSGSELTCIIKQTNDSTTFLTQTTAEVFSYW